MGLKKDLVGASPRQGDSKPKIEILDLVRCLLCLRLEMFPVHMATEEKKNELKDHNLKVSDGSIFGLLGMSIFEFGYWHTGFLRKTYPIRQVSVGSQTCTKKIIRIY